MKRKNQKPNLPIPSNDSTISSMTLASLMILILTISKAPKFYHHQYQTSDQVIRTVCTIRQTW